VGSSHHWGHFEFILISVPHLLREKWKGADFDIIFFICGFSIINLICGIFSPLGSFSVHPHLSTPVTSREIKGGGRGRVGGGKGRDDVFYFLALFICGFWKFFWFVGFLTHCGHFETIGIVVPQVEPSVQHRLHVVTSWWRVFSSRWPQTERHKTVNPASCGPW